VVWREGEGGCSIPRCEGRLVGACMWGGIEESWVLCCCLVEFPESMLARNK
jgi:hypothetical protein